MCKIFHLHFFVEYYNFPKYFLLSFTIRSPVVFSFFIFLILPPPFFFRILAKKTNTFPLVCSGFVENAEKRGFLNKKLKIILKFRPFRFIIKMF